jgi:predicted RNase H-like HicB family nuclease
MTLENYNFDGFVLSLYVDDQGDWLAHFQDIPTISAFGAPPQEALEMSENVAFWGLFFKRSRSLSRLLISGSLPSPDQDLR